MLLLDQRAITVNVVNDLITECRYNPAFVNPWTILQDLQDGILQHEQSEIALQFYAYCKAKNTPQRRLFIKQWINSFYLELSPNQR
jgi:hypothetical protein